MYSVHVRVCSPCVHVYYVQQINMYVHTKKLQEELELALLNTHSACAL